MREGDVNRLLDDVDFGEGFEGCRDRLIIEMFYVTGMAKADIQKVEATVQEAKAGIYKDISDAAHLSDFHSSKT